MRRYPRGVDHIIPKGIGERVEVRTKAPRGEEGRAIH